VSHSHIKLTWIFNIFWEPLFINFYELFNAIIQFISVEERHIQMIWGIQELIKMELWSKRLWNSGLFVLSNAKSFVARYTIMKRCSRDFKLDWTIGNDLRLFPTFCSWPIDCKHMICVNSSKF
jgi:hypothetical protein